MTDDNMPYVVSALAIGGTLGVVGLAMYLFAKKSDKTPFHKDENPTREFTPPSFAFESEIGKPMSRLTPVKETR